MQRDEYRTRLGAIQQAGHEMHEDICALMDDVGNAATAEWQTLIRIMEAVSIATGLANEQLYPHPSALEDSVAMVCTICRQPVARDAGQGNGWHHIDPNNPHAGTSVVRTSIMRPAGWDIAGPAASADLSGA